MDDGFLEDLKKLFSCKWYVNVRDRCGCSLLYWVIFKKYKLFISFFLDECVGYVILGDMVRLCGFLKDCSFFLFVLILLKVCKNSLGISML